MLPSKDHGLEELGYFGLLDLSLENLIYDSHDPLAISVVTASCSCTPLDIYHRVKLLQPAFPVPCFDLSCVVTLNPANHTYSAYILIVLSSRLGLLVMAKQLLLYGL